MPFVLPEVVVRTLLDEGIKDLRKSRETFNGIFSEFTKDELKFVYGEDYINQIWDWFSTTKIPVIQAWSFNAQVIPCVSVHLANETEDEAKAAIGDLLGPGHRFEVGTAVFTVMLDIGLHTARAGDQVLWMYYIVSYLLFKHKLQFERLGLKLQTYSASDYAKDADKMGASGNNIWTRWIRFRCTTENFWAAQPYKEIEHVNTHPSILGPEAVDIATSLDVDPKCVDLTANKGIQAEPQGEDGGMYDPWLDGKDDDFVD